MKNESTVLLETRANLSMNWDMDNNRFTPLAELVLMSYSPTYRMPAEPDGKMVKEYITHTQRITVSAKATADLIKSLQHIQAQVAQFQLLADHMQEMMRPRGEAAGEAAEDGNTKP